MYSVVDLQTFLLPLGSDLYVEAQARYATVVSEFGYYTPVGAPVVYNALFSSELWTPRARRSGTPSKA